MLARVGARHALRERGESHARQLETPALTQSLALAKHPRGKERDMMLIEAGTRPGNVTVDGYGHRTVTLCMGT